jgi:hypothetical protein
MLLIPLLGFIFISLLVAAGAMVMAPSGAGTLERRLEELADWQGRPIAEDDGSGAPVGQGDGEAAEAPRQRRLPQQ